MKSGYSAIDETNGVFGVTVKSEWKVVPQRTLALRNLLPALPWSPFLANPRNKYSLDGSLHRNVFDMQSTGVSSCHVAMSDRLAASLHADHAPMYVAEFDLPTTAKEEFIQAFVGVANVKVEHPWFDLEKNEFREDYVSIGNTTRISFHQVAH
jgi:hypothetical protein